MKKTVMINIRVTERQKRKMQDKANKYTDGNLSEWVKISSINYVIDESGEVKRGEK